MASQFAIFIAAHKRGHRTVIARAALLKDKQERKNYLARCRKTFPELYLLIGRHLLKPQARG